MSISVRQCAESINSAMQTQGQGHSLRSWDLPLKFVSASYLLYLWKTKDHGHSSRSLDLPLNFLSITYLLLLMEGFSLNFVHPFISLTQCAEPMNNYVDLRSQCKVIGFTPQLYVCSISL